MVRPDFLPEAERDLDGIKAYIARDNPRRALSLIRELRRTCQRLAHNPSMGRSRHELRPGLRSFPHGSYVIFCRQAAGGIEIVRVLHGARCCRRVRAVLPRPRDGTGGR